MRGFRTSDCGQLLFWRALYAATDVSHSGQTAKVSAASPLTQKPDQAKRRFRLGMIIFFAVVAWGGLTAMNAPKLGLAMLFGVGFGLLIERADLLYFGIP